MKNKIKSIFTSTILYAILTIVLFISFLFVMTKYNNEKEQLQTAYDLMIKNKINTDILYSNEEIKLPETTKQKVNTASEDAKLEKELYEVANNLMTSRYTYTEKSNKEDIRKNVKKYVTEGLYERKLKEELLDDVLVFYEGTKSTGKVTKCYFENLNTDSPKGYIYVKTSYSSTYRGKTSNTNREIRYYVDYIKNGDTFLISELEKAECYSDDIED